MSFKKGDKVKIVLCDGDDDCELVGKVTEVTGTYTKYGDTCYNLKLNTGTHYWTEKELELIKENSMSKKYYRVLQDTPVWNAGAILEHGQEIGNQGGYHAINDLWDACDLNGEYLTTGIVEAEENSKFFERVYPMGKLEKMVFGTKKQAQAAASALYKGNK